jgi:predicted metalloprotease with PDZ domain
MLSFFVLAFSFFSFFQGTQTEISHYRIKAIPLSDPTNLEISLNYKTAKNEPLTVKLPVDCYGTPKLARFVISFTGQSGTLVKNGKDDSERIVQPNAQGEIYLKYTLAFDPQALANNTYSPNVGNGYFHLAGCQWMLQTGSREEKRLHIIEMIDAPKDWVFYSSLSANPARFEGIASYSDLQITAFGGGNQGFSQFLIKGKPVSVFVRGKFTIPQTEILKSVRDIVTMQRQRFNDFDQPFYHVVILPKEGNVAGVRIDNLFVSFFKSDVTRNQLYGLLSHEMLHNWLTTNLIKPPEGETTLRYQWFYEGFTDYFSRKILLDAGRLTRQRFAELINRDIINIADNPHKEATYKDIVEATETGKFAQAFNKLAYYRGALIALNWDAKIRATNKGKSLGNLIEEVYRLALASGSIDEPTFFALVQKNYAIDAKADFERYILRGEPITVAADALGNDYKLRDSSSPSFDPGFLLSQSQQAKKISGVTTDSAAYRAGLRNNMELVRVENYNRFSNAWDPSSPMIVVVKEQNKERKISFLPHGTAHKLLLFEPTGKKRMKR